MRLEITLNSQKEISIDTSLYTYILQRFVYKLLDSKLGKFLHNEGYKYEKRSFKLFTFSRLIGSFKNLKTHFQFTPPVKFVVSSPKDEILESLAKGLLTKEKFLLGNNEVFVEAIVVLPKISFGSDAIIKMLSPVTVYSTLKKPDGSKKTYYYSPFEEEFSELIRENLRKKCQVIFDKKIDDFDFHIEPHKVKPSDEKIIIYKKPKTRQTKHTVIKGWMGIYKLKGNPKNIELAYNTGIGSKNSLGFGCFEVVSEKE